MPDGFQCYQSVKNDMGSPGAADVFKIPESPWLPAKITSSIAGHGSTGNRLYSELFKSTTKEAGECSLPPLHPSQQTPTLPPAGAGGARAVNAP